MCVYRFQANKDSLTPVRLRQLVIGYFVGKMRFCAAFYYLRSTAKQLNTMRFYYGMSLAAILGLNAYEALGGTCCKKVAVAENNETMRRLRELTGMPSMEEIAAQDAEIYIRQVANIRKEWFVPRDDKLRTLENERRHKCEKNNKYFFPKFLSEEKENTLTADCWQLAKKHRELRGETPKKSVGTKRKTDHEYKHLWESSLKIVKQELATVSARIAHETFRVMVQHKMDILEDNDRRSKWRTPSSKLIIDKRCTVFPPVWEENGGKRLKIDFNCQKEGPKIYRENVYKKAFSKSLFSCLACGDLVKAQCGVKCVKCKVPHRVIHAHCASKLSLQKRSFVCNKISEFLVPAERGGSEVHWKSNLTKVESLAEFLCVICGEATGGYGVRNDSRIKRFDDNTISCRHAEDSERPCTFRVHEKCWKFHGELTETTTVYECKEVKFQMRPETIKSVTGSSIVCRKDKLENLRRTGKLQKQVDKRKRRYVNADLECDFCGEVVPLHQRNQLLQFCRGIKVTPVVPESITDYGALARRAFAIGKRRLESNSIRLIANTTPQRSNIRIWGERPGESISELNPRRKRPRLNFQNPSQK